MVQCTNCGLAYDDPGATGNKCPKCGNGAMVHEDSELLND